MKKIFKVSLIFILCNIFGKVLSLFKDILIANTYGVSAITDAYNLSMTIPNILYSVCVSAIMITFIPNFYEEEKNYGITGALNFSNRFITLLLIISLILTILSSIFTDTIISLIAPGLDSNTHLLAMRLTRITLINLISMVIYSVYSSILRSKDKFIGISLVPIFVNLPLILSLVINKKLSIEVVTVLNSFGLVLQSIILIPEIRNIGFKFQFKFNGYKDRITNMLKSMIPMIIGLSIVQLSQIIDKIIGSNLSVGSITSLEMSNKIVTMIYGILSTTIVTIFTPVLSRKFLNNDKEEWIKMIEKVCKYMILILVPLSMGLLVLNNNIIELLYSRGNFTSEDTKLVSMALIGYVIQIPFMSIRDIIGQGFYSMKNTITPAINGSISVIINIILTIFLSKFWGIFGITLATSISVIIGAFMLMYSLKNRFNIFNIKQILIYLWKVCTSSIIMGISLKYIKVLTSPYFDNLLVIIFSTVGGLSIFIIISLLLRIEEITYIKKRCYHYYEKNYQ